MIEFKTTNPKVALLLNDTVEITFTATKSILKAFEGLDDKELSVTVKRYSKPRSLSQNAYFWTLLGHIGAKINTPKETVYKHYIHDYGVYEILPVKSEAVESFNSKWSSNGLGWFTEDLGESKLDGYTKLVVYFGSSSYKSEEMKRLLDAVIQDCKELGLNTMSLSDIMLLKNDND